MTLRIGTVYKTLRYDDCVITRKDFKNLQFKKREQRSKVKKVC